MFVPPLPPSVRDLVGPLPRRHRLPAADFVIPAQAGTQSDLAPRPTWFPACAGMTEMGWNADIAVTHCLIGYRLPGGPNDMA